MNNQATEMGNLLYSLQVKIYPPLIYLWKQAKKDKKDYSFKITLCVD